MAQRIDYTGYAVLFVDYEEKTLRLVKKIFSSHFRVFTAPNIDAAKEVLEGHSGEIGVIVADSRLPGTSGLVLLNLMRERYPDIPRILTTTTSDPDDMIKAVHRGEIFRYLPKPWNATALADELMHALELFALRTERALLLKRRPSDRRRETPLS